MHINMNVKSKEAVYGESCYDVNYGNLDVKQEKKGVDFMPFFDGSGSVGKGRGGRSGKQNPDCPNRGGMGGTGFGTGGNCICPNCGETVPHQRQVPCTSLQCPKCGSRMIRQH